MRLERATLLCVREVWPPRAVRPSLPPRPPVQDGPTRPPPAPQSGGWGTCGACAPRQAPRLAGGPARLAVPRLMMASASRLTGTWGRGGVSSPLIPRQRRSRSLPSTRRPLPLLIRIVASTDARSCVGFFRGDVLGGRGHGLGSGRLGWGPLWTGMSCAALLCRKKRWITPQKNRGWHPEEEKGALRPRVGVGAARRAGTPVSPHASGHAVHPSATVAEDRTDRRGWVLS